MAPVIGLLPEEVLELIGRIRVGDVDVTNYNAPTQIVLSGGREAISAMAVRGRGGRYVPLNVSAAFHSRHTQQAAEAFSEALSHVSFGPPRIPVISNVTAHPYPVLGIPELLVCQVHSPVRWVDSMRTLAKHRVAEVVEVGQGRS